MFKIVYNVTKKSCPENSHLSRLGMTGFEPTQIDTLSFVPLDKKVLSILQGNPNFTAEDIELDYDEEESDSWDSISDESEDSLEPFPINEYYSKEDIISIISDNENKIKSAKSRVEATVIDETKDNSSNKSEASNDKKD